MAFAANRLDHGDRVISPWLEGANRRILISDRYYLSSLVYQSNEALPMSEVMEINNQARHPDIIFFMNVSNEVCFQRMKIRNQPQELFETNLSETREKYYRAIEFLRKEHSANIIEIDGNGTIDESLLQLSRAIYQFGPKWKEAKLLDLSNFNQKEANNFRYNGSTDWTLSHFLNDFRQNPRTSKEELYTAFNQLSDEKKGSLCISFIDAFGYQMGARQLLADVDAFELRYTMSLGLDQRGSILFLQKPQQSEKVFSYLNSLSQGSDFLFVFSPSMDEVEVKHFERELFSLGSDQQSLSPNIRFLTGRDIIAAIVS